MKYVINACFGGFSLPDEYLDLPTCPTTDMCEDGNDVRTDSRLIEMVENHPWWDLAVVTVPDDATDTYLTEYDGAETLLYVQNGKIYEAE